MPRPDQTPAGSAREVALRALRDVDVKSAYANLALDAHLTKSGLSGRDRGLATELAYGVTRRRGTLDWAIGQVASRPLDQTDPWIRNVLREAAYQLLYMDRIPASAAVDEAVNLARKYGHEGVARFVNGVLRNLLRRLPTLPWPDPAVDPVTALVIRHSYPEWLVREWTGRFGVNAAVELMVAGNRVPPLTIRANRLRGTRDEVVAALAAEDVTAAPTRFSPQGLIIADLSSSSFLDRLKAMKAGLFTVQDESSMLVGPALDPQPGWTVLDMAAAPGGKATHLAELMGNTGRVIAVDIHPHKVDLIRANAKRLGASIVEGLCADAREVGKTLAGQADAVLCDVPCSGLGTLARRPDARWRKTAADAGALVPVQRAILQSAALALKPGGVLVYSTCTLQPAENEDMVAAFLQEHPDFHPEDLAPHLPAGLDPEGAYLHLYPHIHETDGFFIARLRREA